MPTAPISKRLAKRIREEVELDLLTIGYQLVAFIRLPPPTSMTVLDHLRDLNAAMNLVAKICSSCIRSRDVRAPGLALQAADLGNAAATLVTQFQLVPTRNDLHFSFGKAALFGYLVDAEWYPNLVQNCGVITDSRRIDLECYVRMDSGIVARMALGKELAGYDQTLENFRRRQRQLIWHTYTAYLNLIRAGEEHDWNAIPVLVRECEKLYVRRAKDLIYQNFDFWDGTCRYNKTQMDFRLATILKWLFRDHPHKSKLVKTEHRWPYGSRRKFIEPTIEH